MPDVIGIVPYPALIFLRKKLSALIVVLGQWKADSGKRNPIPRTAAEPVERFNLTMPNAYGEKLAISGISCTCTGPRGRADNRSS